MCPHSLKAVATETPGIPDILKCDASELAEFLLKNRFQEDAVATASFLLQCAAALPNAEEISAQIVGEAGAVEEAEPAEVQTRSFGFGDAISEPIDVSLTAPRAKFQWTFHDEGIHFVNAKGEHLLVPSNSVERMVLFPKPEDCRKSHESVGDMVLLIFKTGGDDIEVTFKEKKLKLVCLQLPTASPNLVQVEEDDERDWAELLCTSLDLDPLTQVARVYHPTVENTKRSGYSFESYQEENVSTTTGCMPFVKCHKGVQDGALYPMKEGLLFFKPPFFLHRSEMHSIACGRGSGGSRYVDMVVSVNDGDSQKELEFRNIHRDELKQLNSYIHETLIPAMTKDANGENAEETASSADDSDATQETESGASSVRSPSSRKPRASKRKASRAARERTRLEVSSSQAAAPDEEDDEHDEQWDSSEEDDAISNSDMSETGVNDVPVDESEDDDEYNSEVVEDDSDDDGDATESENDELPQSKRVKTH